MIKFLHLKKSTSLPKVPKPIYIKKIIIEIYSLFNIISLFLKYKLWFQLINSEKLLD